MNAERVWIDRNSFSDEPRFDAQFPPVFAAPFNESTQVWLRLFAPRRRRQPSGSSGNRYLTLRQRLVTRATVNARDAAPATLDHHLVDAGEPAAQQRVALPATVMYSGSLTGHPRPGSGRRRGSSPLARAAA